MNRLCGHILTVLAVAAVFGCRQSVAREPEPAEEPPKVCRHTKLLFAGDVMCHMPQISAAARNADGKGYDFNAVFEYVKPMFDSAAVAIVNLETVISPDGRYAGYPCFSSPRELAAALKEAGVDIAVTANNHCCDRGAKGIRATNECLDALGIAHTGAFADSVDYAENRILRFTADDIDFALLNYTYGTNGIPVPRGCVVNLIDTLAIAADLKETADADCRIVYLHWGTEYRRTMTAAQRSLKEFLQRAGAEIVIGSHPHVIQRAEAADSLVFVSSLGNFVSNQRKRYCDGGLIAEVEVAENPEGGFRYGLKLTPVWVRLPGYRILPRNIADTLRMTAAERAQYELFIADTEELLSDGQSDK